MSDNTKELSAQLNELKRQVDNAILALELGNVMVEDERIGDAIRGRGLDFILGDFGIKVLPKNPRTFAEIFPNWNAAFKNYVTP